MLTFRLRAFVILIAYAIFALLFIAVGIRWHVYRARASLYARQEMEHTFEAANLARAARDPGTSVESIARAKELRLLAEIHERAAIENARIRRLYESFW